MIDKFLAQRLTQRHIFITMLIASVFSFIASFVLSVEAIHLAGNADATFSCDINAVISCGAVARSEQANLFGFPNAFLGMIAEAIVITVALAAIGGVKFPRWYMFTAQIVYTLGLFFAYWLFFQSYFFIGALCPWCLLITFVTTIVFFEMTAYNILQNNLFLKEKVQERLVGWLKKGFDIIVVLLIFVTLTLMILGKYGMVLFS